MSSKKPRSARRSRTEDTILARTTSWDQLKTEFAVLTQAGKGCLFERLVQLYLQLAPVYRSKLRHVWLLDEVPTTTATYLRLPSSDLGIDLIAETFDGAYWAIQCKYRDDETSSLTWDELSTFVGLTFGICNKITFGLICTSTERITNTLTNHPNIGFCAIDTWRHLNDEFFDLVKSEIADKPVTIAPSVPRPHQARAIDSGRNHFIEQGNARGKLIAPCGSGKSISAYWLAQSLSPQLTLVAVPSLALISQTLNIWLRELIAQKKTTDWLCVCSDASAGNVDQDDPILFAHDLGIPCTTDESVIVDWLNQEKDCQRIIFTTYQSGPTVSRAAKKSLVTFDIGIFDEAHKTVGRNDRLFSHLLFDSNITIAHRLFMTATERRFRGDADDIVSMDDATIYGETFELLSFKEALQSDPPILCDYEVLVIDVRHEEVEALIRKNVFVRPNEGKWNDLTAQTLASIIALRKAILNPDFEISHAVSFHSSIARAKDFTLQQNALSKALPSFGNLFAYHVSGRMKTALRDSVITQFLSHSPALMTNARCLTEGINVPEIDCVLFADPKKSTIDIVQASGRAMRLSAGKTKGYVIVPLFIPSEVDEEDFIESSDFKAVVMVLRALASNDERIIEYLQSVSEGKKPKTSLVRFGGNEITPANIDANTFANALQLRCWDKIAGLRWRSFEEAREFARSLKLKSQKAWVTYAKGPDKPSNIPAKPADVYKHTGWIGFGDWLGTGTIAPRLKQYRSYAEARAFAIKLGISSLQEWRDYCKSGNKPDDIPAAPYLTYSLAKHGALWTNWGDFLGTGTVAPFLKQYRAFEEARTFIRSQGLKTTTDWKNYCKSGRLPNDIPASPNKTYVDSGWVSMPDWLGTDNVHTVYRQYKPFDEARTFARGLNLTNRDEWQQYCKSGILPKDVPASPWRIYENEGWISIGDWLGTGMVAPRLRRYRSFSEARQYARSLTFTSAKDWQRFAKSGERPEDIPATPDRAYKNKGWTNWGDWLGTEVVANQKKQFWPFRHARKIVRQLGLQNKQDWSLYCQSGDKPREIPACPEVTYKNDGWKHYFDWLGIEHTNYSKPIARSRPFKDARTYARSLGLKSRKEWNTFFTNAERPTDIPINPDRAYKNKGWGGWDDFLGVTNPRFRSYEESRTFARSLNLPNIHSWFIYVQDHEVPTNIPRSPACTYKNKGWISWADFLGTQNIKKEFAPFKEARKAARSLGVQSSSQWFALSKVKKLPPTLPACPNETYAGKGWQGWGDWLDTGNVAASSHTYRPFVQAKRFVRALKLGSAQAWRQYAKSGSKPLDIPARPEKTYANKGWISWGDWLGTKTIATYSRQHLPFKQARTFVRKLKLKDSADWRAYCKSGKKPQNIPSAAWNVYKDQGWIDIQDWLGSKLISNRKKSKNALPYQKARAYARSLHLQSVQAWRIHIKSHDLPIGIPRVPDHTYRGKGWTTWSDWLGK